MVNDAFAVIVGWCSYADGRRVRLAHPRGFSTAGPEPGAFDEEYWCYARVESALDAMLGSAPCSERSALIALAKGHYWTGSPATDALAKVSLRALEKFVELEVARNPKPARTAVV